MSLQAPNVVTENGEQYIPASQRPDGTWRKARRVKDGYVPQEEVPLYESKGKQFMSKKQGPVMLPSGQTAERPIPGLYILQTDTKKKTKKAKSADVAEVTSQLQTVNLSKTKQSNSVSEKKENCKNSNDAKDESISPEKKLKNLKKKLREVETLEEKIKNGLIAKPEQEQLAKIKRKNEVLMQIHELEKQISREEIAAGK